MENFNDHINTDLLDIQAREEEILSAIKEIRIEAEISLKSVANLISKITSLESAQADLKAKRDYIQSTYPSTKDTSPIKSPIDIPNNYFEFSLAEKIDFILAQEEGGILASSLLAKLLDHEPDASKSDFRKKFTLNLYATLNYKANKVKDILREKVNNEFVYSRVDEK